MKKLIFFSLILFLSYPAFARRAIVQAHGRIGLVSGNFTGEITGGFTVPTSLEGEGEFILNPKMSFFGRMTLSVEPGSGQVKYIYMGVGQRMYLFSHSGAYESFGQGNFVSVTPKVHYFIGWDAGISQVQIESKTSSLGAAGTMIDFGISGGAKYFMTKDFALEGLLGMSKGLGISSVRVDALITRAQVGVTIYY
ncbi:MAG: hypothetical protein KDD50_10795 [Bdellovibrionales bacterium]|nr:hypothetical protein [Bdellovibrionales bacterium]